MATLPDSDSPAPRRTDGRSWSSLVAQARRAPAPRVDTCATVLAAIAAEAVESSLGRDAEADDGWAVFARMFATPRLMVSGAASLCVAGPLALWVLSAGVARMDTFAKFLVYGGLPGWLVAIVA